MWLMDEKIYKWITKPMVLAANYQICNKVLEATDAYYSSCWILSKETYGHLEKSLNNILLFNLGNP